MGQVLWLINLRISEKIVQFSASFGHREVAQDESTWNRYDYAAQNRRRRRADQPRLDQK